jgi:hypothetical protein
VIKGGSAATDTVTATIASTAALTPTITGVETLALTLTSAATVDLENTVGLTKVTLAESDVTNRLKNVTSTVTEITFQEAGDNNQDLRADYATGAAATTEVKFSASSAATAAIAFDDLTFSNISSLTLSTLGSYDVSADAVALGLANTSVTLKTTVSTADLGVGVLTGDALESFNISAVGGDVSVTDVDNGDELTLSAITISASGGADVNVATDLDIYSSGTGVDSSLESISVVGGVGSVITMSTITAGGTSTDTGSDVSIVISLEEDSATSDLNTITVVGVDSLDITLADNAGAASEVGLVTATSGDVGDITITIGEDAILEFDGVTAAKGDVGDISITTGARGVAKNIAGDDVTVTSTEGDIGNISLSAGNGGGIELAATSGSDIGDVTLTALSDSNLSLTAADTIGDVTITVTAGDSLSADIDGLTMGNISITGAGDASVIVASAVGTATTGSITISLTGTGSVASTVDLSDVGAAGTVSVTGGLGADVLIGTATAATLSGGAGADVITGGAGVDTITGGESTDTITGGAGADVITLTETTSAADIVIMTGGIATTDSITGFTVANDLLHIDFSDIAGAVAGTFVLAGNMSTVAAADTAPTFATVSAAYDVSTAATADILVIAGDFTSTTLATALETGGTRALTVNGVVDAGDAFVVVYDDGTDSYVAYVKSTAGVADDGNFSAGDLTVTNMVKLVGIASSTSVVSTNIDIVA